MNIQTAAFLVHLRDIVCEQKGVTISDDEYMEMVKSANIRTECDKMGIKVYQVPRPQEVQ